MADTPKQAKKWSDIGNTGCVYKSNIIPIIKLEIQSTPILALASLLIKYKVM